MLVCSALVHPDCKLDFECKNRLNGNKSTECLTLLKKRTANWKEEDVCLDCSPPSFFHFLIISSRTIVKLLLATILERQATKFTLSGK